MKALILAAFILGSPNWQTAILKACPASCERGLKALAAPAVFTAKGPVVAPAVFAFAGEPKAGAQDGRSEGGKKRIKVEAVAPGQEGGKVQKRIVVTPADEGDRASKGWLGVSVAPVPESLAVQLGTEGRGLIVQNVVEDSPADTAGFQAHDVLLSVGDLEVDADVMTLVKAVGERKPGEQVSFEVLREGEELTLRATLGSRADTEAMQFDWKFETPPDAEVEDQIHTRGHFMFRSPEGEWIMRDLGDLDAIEGLPADVKMLLPESGSRTVQVFVDNDGTKVRTRVERDGSVVVVEQKDDGITVTRTDADGNETANTYASEDELAEADEEAYNALKGAGGAFQFKIDGLDQDDFDFDFDVAWEESMEQSLQHAQEAYERALEQFHQLHAGAGAHFFSLPDQDGKGPHVIGLRSLGKPKHTFEARPDGTIEVRIRKGDSELVQLYRNEQDLQNRAPDLAEKYFDLMEAGK